VLRRCPIAAQCNIDDLDTAAALESTTNCQSALLICGIATARTFAQHYHVSPGFVAGASVGALAAAVTVGALTVPRR
jgi:acyl transferase domain-containing protein